MSAAQVGIAVAGATDAAKNAADLILTEAGLSPIYGAILESRRIFARIKSYVVYRVAASLVLTLTLSIVVFASGCAVDSLLVIILALLNDISMIPVAYDRAKATTKPQLPIAAKLVYQSLFYGIVQTGFALMYIFSMNKAGSHHIDLHKGYKCSPETRGFIWFYLVLVTELAIFSVRATSFFWLSIPSPILALSVLLTCILGGLIACYSSKLSTQGMGYIVLFNLATFVVVDILKVPFRKMIGEDPGEPIENDNLIEIPSKTREKQPSELQQFLAKQMRYQVHRESQMQPGDTSSSYAVVSNNAFLDGFWTGENTVMDGYIRRGPHGGYHGALSSSNRDMFSGGYGRRQRMASSPAAFQFHGGA